MILNEQDLFLMRKYTKGETFVLKLNASENDAEFELYSNLNRTISTYALEPNGSEQSVSIDLNETGFFYWNLRYRLKGKEVWHWVKNSEGKKLEGKVQVDPSWIMETIVYNVFVRFFKGKTNSQGEEIKPGEGGTFDDVKLHLDTLKKLGITTLYFNPIHLIGEINRKFNLFDQLPTYLQPGSPYSIKDYKSIDPELTYDRDTHKHFLSDPQQEFKDLVQAAHERGMFVIMDLVFNHTAHDFVLQRIKPEWFLYKENITSLEDPYLYPQDLKKGKPWGDPKHTLSPYDHGIWWEDTAQLNWEYMIPPAINKPPRNTSLDEMWAYFISIPKYWIKHFGVDGFRCDIAYRIPPAFWKACIAEARQFAQENKSNLQADVIFIAEAYTNNLKELQEAGFTAVYSDFSNKLRTASELKGYLDYLFNLSGDFFPPGSKWFLFPESHDFERTPQKVLENPELKPKEASLVNQSRWVLSATLPGIPLIFNGFEKVEWQPVNLFSYGAVNWGRDNDLHNYISRVNSIRHNQPALIKGDYHYLETNQGLNQETQVFCFLRTYLEEKIIVCTNMDVYQKSGPIIVYLPEYFNQSYQLTDLLNHRKYKRQGRELVIILEPGQSHIFKVELR